MENIEIVSFKLYVRIMADTLYPIRAFICQVPLEAER